MSDVPVTGESIPFKAEIKQLLDILIHSLYTDREIFVRELISNASDALNRARFEILTNRDVLDSDAELKIQITTKPDERILTISDTGIGMTQQDLVENLGTIAHSGVRDFLAAAQDETKNLDDVIGQFGVGFYSVFMAAEWVKVTSRSIKPEAEATSWYATGADTYTLSAAEKPDRGTTIEIKLKEDAAEFAQEHRLRSIIRKHSDYVAFPIYLNDSKEPANRQTAIWRTSPREVKPEQYEDFYKQFTLFSEKPLRHIHVVTDAPVQVYALLYIPGKEEHSIFSLRREEGLKLYSRKVLIQEYTKDLLPEYFRFVQGVVDSEDLPLNVSRETVQSNQVIARLKKILTSEILKSLKDLAQKEPEAYAKFWEYHGRYVKEGIATDFAGREDLYPLLRFHTDRHPDQWSSLKEYVERMPETQKSIYYLLGDDERSILRSPHLDYFKKTGCEVILLADPIDSFMVMGLPEFESHPVENIASPDLELPKQEDELAQGEESTASDVDMNKIVERFKTRLGDKVTDVRLSSRLSDSVARLIDAEGSLNPSIQRVYRLMERDYEAPKKVLELNPHHTVLKNLTCLEEADELAEAIIDQVYESALLIEGLHPDPASMIPRIQALMEAALSKNQKAD